MPARYGHICAVFCLLVLASCAGSPPFDPSVSALYFRTHMVVIEPDQRWQATVDWRALSEDDGLARLAHIATGRIIELRWQGRGLWLRDNHADSADWHSIPARQLIRHGISVLPSDIILFLQELTPPGFESEEAGTWKGERFGVRLSIGWDDEKRRLSIEEDGDKRRVLLTVRG